ncbi:MAG: dihydropteroate synthase [Clostridiales bacterium]|nr:dihydropteroate synthase [Clostridiales bacterium]
MNATDGRFCGIYKCGNRSLEMGRKTLIMGILNLTPDSFSDGGKYTSVDAAVDQAARMIREGADCIDLGAEATGPNAVPISSEEELERLIPSLQAVRSRFDIPLSVDTFKSETAMEAITAGADIINDITGFMGDPEMAKLVAENGVGCILMFNCRTNGENPVAFEPVSRRAVRELTQSVEIAKKAGIEDNMIMTDPGIGFGTTRAQDAELTASTLSMGLQGKHPVLYAASRKRYARVFAGGDQATEAQLDYATAGLSMTAASLGASMVRVHNVAASRQMLDLFDNTFYAFANL